MSDTYDSIALEFLLLINATFKDTRQPFYDKRKSPLERCKDYNTKTMKFKFWFL